MQYRTLGPLRVSALGLGCMGMSEFYGPRDDAGSLDTLEAALDAGVTLFDTADMYGLGHNEELLGRFLAGRREQAVVATKFGIVRDPGGGYARSLDNSPAYLARACEASLRRLNTEYIDLYYVHRVNPEQPIEDTVGAMARLVEAGKVRALGLCEVSPATLRRAQAVHPISAVQTEYSLWTRDPETGVLPVCRELGVGFVAYSPLGRGFLTGQYSDPTTLSDDDFRRYNPRFQGDNLAANLRIADAVRELATARGCSPAQLALAWLLAKGEDIVPIPGTKRRRYLADNLGALAVALSAAECRQLDEALPAASGARYPAEGMKGVDV